MPNIDLPPSGLPDDFDVSKLGTSGAQPPAPRKPKSSSLPPWQWILAALLICGGITFIGSILPDTPEQIAASQTAFVQTATTVFATSVSKSATKPAPTKTITPYPSPAVTATPTTPPTYAEEEASLKDLPGVISVERIERNGTDYWAIVTTHPKFNKESFAQLLQIQAIHVNPHILRFAVRIDDKGSDPRWWIYTDDLQWVSSSTPPAWADLGSGFIPQTVAQEGIAATSSPTLKPKNCKTAVAAGMSAQQASAAGLDRDKDGVACYGD